MLVPAMLLVLIVLGGIGVDMAITHSAQRSAHKTLSAAADDAAGMIDAARQQTDGTVVLDQAAARNVALAHLGPLPTELGGGDNGLPYRVVEADVSTTDHTITITARIEVDHIFIGAVPGVSRTSTVTVTTTGRLLP
jgi:hypothetical protein